jgi:predicted metal-dependent enzyme (double-stranded beta helix superfamily)
MFDPDRFVADCREANTESDAHKAVQEIVATAVSNPMAALQGLGDPQRASVQKLYHSPDLTILNVIWGPQMTLMPHNHEMWAVIGVYTGREDNIFWRRLPERDDGKLRAAGAKELCVGDVAPLGKDIIHSVTNPIPRLTGAIHVYGGDFFETPRSEWDPETLLEGPYDVEKNMRLFEESNSRLNGS